MNKCIECITLQGTRVTECFGKYENYMNDLQSPDPNITEHTIKEPKTPNEEINLLKNGVQHTCSVP